MYCFVLYAVLLGPTYIATVCHLLKMFEKKTREKKDINLRNYGYSIMGKQDLSIKQLFQDSILIRD